LPVGVNYGISDTIEEKIMKNKKENQFSPAADNRIQSAESRQAESSVSNCTESAAGKQTESALSKLAESSVNNRIEFSANSSFEARKNIGPQTAVFGGGCFWCLEAVFIQLKGVIKVESGYSGGHEPEPDYMKVCSEKTGHAEVIRIEFDPEKINYELLLRIFFAVHDPTTFNRQGYDRGTQYRSIILYNSPQQEQIALRVIREIEDSEMYPSSLVTEIKPLTEFYRAEDYHQEYFFNNPNQPYCQAVISPKVKKLQEQFASYLKK
jgi:peptide-methionine (S)-S-oxide reductase